MTVSETPSAKAAVIELFRNEGTPAATGGNHPFIIDDPRSAWLVEEGQVNIFTVGVENGEPVGARDFYLHLEEGDFFFGMDLDSYGMGSGFLAVGKVGTKLRRISVERLEELAADKAYAEAINDAVTHWVLGLSKSLTKEIIPGPLVDLNLVPEDHVILENQQKVRAAKGLLWLEIESGNLLFIGMEALVFEEESAPSEMTHHTMSIKADAILEMIEQGALPSSGGSSGVLFPLSVDTWVEASNDGDHETQLKAHAGAGIIGTSGAWEGLKTFHEVLCQCEFINKKLQTVDEFNRLKSKAEYAVAARKGAIKDLAAVMTEEDEEVVLDVEDVDDDVYEAARLVCDASFILAKRHPEMKQEGSNSDRLAVVAKASRFRMREVALRDEWWRFDQGAMFAEDAETEAPIALVPRSPTSYEYVNTRTGERGKVNRDVAESLNVMAWSFYRPFPDGPMRVIDIMKFGLKGLYSDAALLVAMGITIGMLGAATPFFTGKIFDDAIPQAERGLLVQFAVALLAMAFTTAAFDIAQAIAILRISGRMDYSIGAALWDRLLNLPSTFFKKFSAGDLADRAGGINAIRDLVSGAGIAAILGSFSSIFYIFLMFKYSTQLAFAAMGLTLFFISFTFAMNYLQLRFQREQMTIAGRLSGLVLQLITGVAKIRVSGSEDHAYRVWAREFSSQRRLQFLIGRVQNAVEVFNSAFATISSMVIFFVLYTLKQKAAAEGGAAPALSTGDFIAFNAAYGSFLAATQQLSEASLKMLKVIPIYERLKPIITEPAEIDETRLYPGRLTGEIEISHIHFKYTEDGPWVLRDISLKIEPGEFIAFVGGSGSGKSTLFRVMLGFEVPQKGSVYYDGQDLNTLDLREVRQQLGVVLQDSQLLPTDVFRNIVGTTSLTIDDAWEAARAAGMEEDIQGMPMGMHTYVSEGGGGFSGGQKQRLKIARSIVHKPRIMFMDEATSALDNRTQKIVTESMDRMQATRFVIAHRLSTIRNADRICYLDKGRLAEIGSYDELMEKRGLFYELASRQTAEDH
ncbi:MAG: NHLP bacteriocin export ABC transporter permease/ATPase subunit [Acidobacteriota bacterium]